MKLNRSYSLLEIRTVDDEKRIIEGIATTPSVARDGDIIETEGIIFKLPIPFLLRHKQEFPLGNVISASAGTDGIRVRIQVASAGVAEHIDEAWRMIKAGVIRGLSLGWRTLEEKFDKVINGFRIIKSEWLELSAVPVPADMNATITSVRSIDTEFLAASGNTDTRSSVVRLNLPGVSGLTTKTKGKTMAKKNLSEHIAALQARHDANQVRIDEINDKVVEEGRTRENSEIEECRTLKTENERLQEDIDDFKKQERAMVAAAVTVTPETAGTPEKAAAVRGPAGSGIQVRSNLPKGTTFSRWVMAQVEAKGDRYRAPEIAKQFWPDHPEVELILRAGVNAGTTTHATWASPLIPAAQTMTSEFYDLLRPMSILGRIQGMTRVPANIIVPVQTGGGTGNWVGETLPKPVSALAFTTATLRWAKAVVMTVLSEELIRFSSPNAETVVRESIAKDLAAFEDAWFVSATIESANVSPAGIRWNAPTSAASGVTAAAFLTDFKTALATFIAANYDLSKLVILMSSTVALNVSTLKDSLGNFIYPTLNMQSGGSILGIPVVVSEAVGTNIIFLNASEILLADDGGITIDASNQASILMDDAPNASPTTTSLVSLYQRNLVAIKAEHFLTWKKVRSTTAYYLSNAAYTG